MTDNLIIGSDSEVILHFDLKLEDGSAADSTRVNNKPAKMVMGDGSLTPNFEACLLGLQKGEKKSFTLAANDAFQEGAILAFSQPDGSEIPGIIRSVAGDSITVDFNHPLAGQTVIFDVEIVDVKAAPTPEGDQ